MASSIRGGWCLWKERWHWSHTDKEVFLCISLWTLCHVLSTLLRNSPLNIQSRIFYFKKSAFCLTYAAHSKEVTQPPILSSPLTTREATQVTPLLSLSAVAVCFRAISVSDRYQDACFFLPCHRTVQAERAHCRVSCQCCLEQYYGVCGGSFCLFDEFLWWWYVR